jgi:Spy/CpxP family protein refolding chaperone
MNRNAVYVAVFAVLCVLAGVLVGAGIVKKVACPGFGPPGGPNFAMRAERFMGRGPGGRFGGASPVKMLADRLDLDKEQETEVGKILEGSRQEIDKLGEDVRYTIDKIKSEGDERIMKILDPAQQEKFMALLEEMRSAGCPQGGRGPRDEYGPPSEDLPPRR